MYSCTYVMIDQYLFFTWDILLSLIYSLMMKQSVYIYGQSNNKIDIFGESPPVVFFSQLLCSFAHPFNRFHTAYAVLFSFVKDVH